MLRLLLLLQQRQHLFPTLLPEVLVLRLEVELLLLCRVVLVLALPTLRLVLLV
jgi:hypothetical protein